MASTISKPMLEPGFHFSQYNLQDFVDCARRFELRHLRKLEWPAVQSAPVIEQERAMERGSLFHRLVQQYITGIPAELIQNSIADEQLLYWWHNFITHDPLAAVPSPQRAEYTLSVPWQGFRLLAKYDVLAVNAGGRAVIMDWKTSQRRTPRETLMARVQTRLYPLLLALRNEGKSAPEEIFMIYWFAEFPEQPEVMFYNSVHMERDRDYIAGLIDEIQACAARGEFLLTEEQRKCAYCQYRSFCDRGTAAGLAEDAQESTDEGDGLSLDFEQIGEIAF